jgi:hypothetical protein
MCLHHGREADTCTGRIGTPSLLIDGVNPSAMHKFTDASLRNRQTRLPCARRKPYGDRSYTVKEEGLRLQTRHVRTQVFTREVLCGQLVDVVGRRSLNTRSF